MTRTIAYVFGAIMLVLGLWGFVQNPILDLFAVNTLHNLVHVVSGLILLAVAMWAMGSARMTFIVLGAVYLLVVILQVAAPDLTVSLFNTSPADLWLHLVFAVALIGAGWMCGGRSMAAMPPASSM